MRILYLCTYYERAMIFRDAMNGLEKRGHSVLAFNAVVKGRTIEEKYLPIMDEKVIHKECFTKYDRLCFPVKQKKFQNALEQNVNVKEFDLIHSHTLFNGGWVAYQIHKKYGIPYIVSVRDTDLNAFLRFPGFKKYAVKIAENASGILFLSASYRIRFADLCFKGADKERILNKSVVIPNGLEPFWIENISEAKSTVHDPLELLYVGRVDKVKNIETTVKVLNRLNEEGTAAHLTVIGKINYPSAEALLTSNQNITTIPFSKKEELIKHYKNADVFIMPSLRETFGRVYIESITQGTPVVYTRGEGFDKLFPDGTVGYSADPKNVGEIVAAVRSIVDNYAEISTNCVENSRMFNWDTIAEKLEKLYLSAL